MITFVLFQMLMALPARADSAFSIPITTSTKPFPVKEGFVDMRSMYEALMKGRGEPPKPPHGCIEIDRPFSIKALEKHLKDGGFPWFPMHCLDNVRCFVEVPDSQKGDPTRILKAEETEKEIDDRVNALNARIDAGELLTQREMQTLARLIAKRLEPR